ncbi:hypothetical protein AB0P17_02930 [Streptomyces sp. NPDC088124]|uniref:hypothetical protein n=1 Tax=Streptomyces sp. NPDC088124 TaxID=3154654 RepID=UPI00342461A8
MSEEYESDAQKRLSEIVGVVVEVAAEAGESGTYTGETARTLTAVAVKVGARIAVEAEVRGFTGGWQEAVVLLGTGAPAPLRADSAAPEGPDEPRGPAAL